MNSKKLLNDLFQAYYDARRNKRNTISALKFEVDYEKKLFELYEEIRNGNYQPGESVCFISFYPVQREVFAADFRDRIVHHLIYNYISPLFERQFTPHLLGRRNTFSPKRANGSNGKYCPKGAGFINDAYSCREGKGTSYGIKRIDHFIRSCSRNYKKDCYILKLDIKGYFMSMDRFILYDKIEKTLPKISGGDVDFDIGLILYLIRKVIFHDPTKHCRVKGKKSDWQGLPASKSLFCAKPNQGLPIGNLTSQLFGNVYLNDFDHFIKYNLRIKYYGRYVDDMVLVHQDKEYLRFIIPKLKKYLRENIDLELHPNKVYLQHFSKGVNFLGVIIKPYRVYIRNRIKGNFYKKIKAWNNYLKEKENKLSKEEARKFLSCVNSYLGLMKHYKTRKIRRKMLAKNLSVYFWNYFYIAENYSKLVLRG